MKMRKKKRLNGKIVFTITLVFILGCFMTANSWAAQRVEFCQANAKDYMNRLNENKSLESVSIGKTLGLTGNEGFLLLRQITDFNGVTHYRYQQAYKGIPVWGMQTIVSIGPSNEVTKLHGTMVLDIANDIKGLPPASSLDPAGALKRMKTLHKERNIAAAWHFSNEQYGTYIYVDKTDRAHLCDVVSFFADTGCGEPSRFIHFIEVKTGKVLHAFDMLAYAEYAAGTGPGGNIRIGAYYYGTDYPPFPVTEESGTCTMVTTEIKTVDLNHKTTGTTPFSYPCYENTHEPVNGGYCPLNDAHSFGKQVFDMYNGWYGVPPVPFQLTIRCHYSVDYDGWFWDGATLTFGDGDVIFFPPVGLDIIGHEVSHGFTDYNSGLIYSGQSGGINESFSDMAGEAAKYFLDGINDFMVGSDICKSCTALRYLFDPPLDGNSIDHVDDYHEGMDPHYSSGIFNKVFYLLATSQYWNTHKAFDIFVRANRFYWTPNTNFQQGAEAAAEAALDYGYSYEDVKEAFSVVGIDIGGSVPCPGTITNAGFETGDTSGWTEAGNVGITTDSHTGSYAVSLNSADSSVEQVINQLCGSTTYTVSCWGKAKSSAGVYLGVKDYGGAEQTVQFTDFKNFVKESITFTTGTANTSATIFFIKLGSRFDGLADDFEIVQN
jgi:Zn-dependent metalloprotease